MTVVWKHGKPPEDSIYRIVRDWCSEDTVDVVMYARFSNGRWYCGCGNIVHAATADRMPSDLQSRRWLPCTPEDMMALVKGMK